MKRVLAVNERLSQQGILQRYENQKADRGAGRMTTAEAHQAALDGMPVTLERIERDKLADRVTVYRRGGEVIYRNALQDGEWTELPLARAKVDEERSRPMTLAERREYAQGFAHLVELMARPERRASAVEVKAMEDLQLHARRELIAEVLRNEIPDQAMRQYPALAPAYAYVQAIEAKALSDGLNEQQRAAVRQCVIENVSARILQGEMPQVELRDTTASKLGQIQEQER